ncbi:MAG: hypothetical protein ACRD88_03845 [Terriglobia bacterium]
MGLDLMDECAAAGARMWGQATTRSINAIFSLKSYLRSTCCRAGGSCASCRSRSSAGASPIR